jgi:thiamine pyrophosphate-dependent acetolactate synthase large subunit-like protein
MRCATEFRVEKTGDIGKTIEKGFALDAPVVVDAIVRSYESPMPA